MKLAEWLRQRFPRYFTRAVSLYTYFNRKLSGQQSPRSLSLNFRKNSIRKENQWCTEETINGIRILRVKGIKDFRHTLSKRILRYLLYTVISGITCVTMVGKVHRILVGTDPIFLMPVVILLSKIKRAPMILDERDLFPETAIALNVIQDGLLAGMLFRMQQFFRKKSISILAATPGIMRRLISYGCPEEKIQILYNADVYLCEYDLKMPIVSLRKQINRNFVVGYVGGLGKANDIKTLLRAARHLEGIEDIGIIIIGSGENKTLYKKWCIQNNLKNVFIKGSFPRVETRRLIGEMNVCVHLMKNCSFFRMCNVQQGI